MEDMKKNDKIIEMDLDQLNNVSGGSTSYVCSKCGARFSDLSALMNHADQHAPSDPASRPKHAFEPQN